ncbi:sigma-54-dependent Fis family transcriptional regulator [Nocardia amamiensis]|uniref:sigma-54-dependent Fis family transcriptional regulator n=1 Tax=Nocardia amamiensis TaxID=404578 RepID=UPI00082F9028|nr:helix-turn-helix domain-containing protein [Nocardia amamiensis]
MVSSNPLSPSDSKSRLGVARARDEFLSNTGVDLSHVRPLVVRSWYRSLAAGVDAIVDRDIRDQGHVDERTMQAAELHLRRLDEIAADMGGYVSLTAPSGVLVQPSYLRDEESFPAGYSLLEENCGSNGEGIALEEGRSVWVAPEEHFREDMRRNWCFASLVRDPFHSRVRAVIGLTLPAEHVRGIEPAATLLTLEGVAARIGREIEARASARERALFDEYMTVSRRRGNSAVIAMDGKNALMNASATSSLEEGDFLIIASYAKEVMSLARETQCEVNLRGPGTVTLDISPVQLTQSSVGAIVVMRPGSEPRTTPRVGRQRAEPAGEMPTVAASDALSEHLDGVSAEFQRILMLARKVIEQARSAAIIGEAGTGKRRLAHTIAGTRLDYVEFDCQAYALGYQQLAAVVQCVSASSRRTLVLENADSLSVSKAVDLVRVLKGLSAARVIMTVTRPTDATLHISEAFDALEIAVAPLRKRREDIPVLAEAFAIEMGGRRLSRRLLTALTDSDWPRNIDQLRTVVSNAIEHSRGAEVIVDDLPQGLRRAMTNGRLSRLEDAELGELRSALREADGNKRLAAELLDIGRSTLYRRMDYFTRRGFEL